MSAVIEKAARIRLLILDVDGVLTSGLIYYGPQGTEMRGFHIQDGLGIKLLQQAGIPVAIISGKKSAAVEKRLTDLDVQHLYLGHENKLPAYEELKQKLQLEDQQIAYMGDDLPDLPLLRRAGLAISVPNAPVLSLQAIDFVTKNLGGAGAVREVCEFILKAQERYQAVVQSYFN